MKKSTKIVIAALTALGLSGGVFAYGKTQEWRGHPEHKIEFAVEMATKKLDLDESQQQNLKLLADDVLVLMEEMRAGREAHMNELKELVAAPSLDQNRALQMIQEKTQAVNDKAPAALASLGLFLDSLDSEQKAKLQKFMDKRHDRHHKHEH